MADGVTQPPIAGLAEVARAVLVLTDRVKQLEADNARRARMGRVVSITPTLEVRLEGDTENVPAAFKSDGSTPAPDDIVKAEWVDGRLFVTPYTVV